MLESIRSKIETADRLAKVAKLNIGCGNARIEGYLNIDAEESLHPDIVLNVKHGLPCRSETIDEILFFHAIEHIEEKSHHFILTEFWRVLKPRGALYISYPEFTKCAQNYIENKRGAREFGSAHIWITEIYR